MQKVTKQNKSKFEKEIMTKISSEKITMKPKWYFWLGSILTAGGLIALSFTTVFMINLITFIFRARGPMANWKIGVMLQNYPWWVFVAAIIGIVGGIVLLKRYDFSYKKNFAVIAIFFILSLILSGILVDKLGINKVGPRFGVTRKIYQNIENREKYYQNRQNVKGVQTKGQYYNNRRYQK